MATDDFFEAVYRRLLHNIALPGWQTNREVYAPQRRHIPSQGSSIQESGDSEMILFAMSNGSFISAMDAHRERLDGLLRGEETMFHGCSSTISLRIEVGIKFNSWEDFECRTGVEWPGYGPWTDQIRTLDWHEPPNKITRCRLLTEIAKRLDKFLRQCRSTPVDPGTRWWRAGVQGGIQLENIVIVGLERVALGSWQRHLMYRPPPCLA